MAKDDKAKISKRLSDLVAGVRANMNNIYINTYYNSNKNSKDLEAIRADINKSIDRITDNNLDQVGLPNISKLYSRIGSIQKDTSVIRSIENVFEDNILMDGVLGSYMQNKYLKDLDNEIDVLCKYMPKLLEALETRKDNVLSADHFSKDFINVTNHSAISKEVSFNDRINALKDQYDLLNLLEDYYDNAAKYGEQFVYIVPYKKAIAKLLQNKTNTLMASLQTESGQIICEGSKPIQMKNYAEVFSDKDNFEIKIELNTSNVLESAVMNMNMADKKLKTINESSLNANPVLIESKQPLQQTISDDLTFEKDSSTQDGLISSNDTETKNNKLNVPGCVIKKLDRSCVVPVYIEDLCLGYYYFEFAEYNEMYDFHNTLSDPLVTMKSTSKLHANIDDVKQDQMLKYISAQISQFIDSKFVNNNQDLRKEIYMVLKHNDIFNSSTSNKFKVTFIPPEDMIHIRFKEDPKTHRGISDLERALIPAKLYSCLYITNTIAAMTRGQDKRVYYVKQNVDTNIAKTLLTTIDQIKKSNFGIRQVENINNVLNIIGRFNDYVIPLGPSGDSPVQFDIISGQNIDIKTDLMDKLEEMAINSTDVTLELIQARQSIDYAVQLTMTNSKFLRKVYNRQAKYQKFCSEILTKLYNGEYNEESSLTVSLPPPMFLNITNTNQIITNTRDYVESIWAEDVADETDEVFKVIYKRKLLNYHLGSYIDISKHEEIKNQAKQEAALKRSETGNNEEM